MLDKKTFGIYMFLLYNIRIRYTIFILLGRGSDPNLFDWIRPDIDPFLWRVSESGSCQSAPGSVSVEVCIWFERSIPFSILSSGCLYHGTPIRW